MKRLGVPLLLVARRRRGCENSYEAITAPPPGLTASLDDASNAIRLSRGASIAFECTNQEGDPCARVSSTDSASTALIFPASLDTLTEWGYEHSPGAPDRLRRRWHRRRARPASRRAASS